MFLLRSIFWLAVAYVVIHPGVDLRGTAEAVTSKAVATGQQMIADQLRSSCTSFPCQGGAALAAAVLASNPPSDSTMQDSNSTAPVPRPRPHWMG
jgi:hypothetical protein